MSMSQEDIEALMNGLEIPPETSTDTAKEDYQEEEKVDTKEIEQILSQAETQTNISVSNNQKIKEIGNLLGDIDLKIDEQNTAQENTNTLNEEADKKVKEDISSKINDGVLPLPAESDTKVVSQLSQVADDSEEKVGQIFDVLSLTLDNNAELRNKIKEYEEFALSQEKFLNLLSSKFPNINIFQKQLEKVKKFESSLQGLTALIDDEDMHIFEGMELMQFNDINRQKIERVMSVIRKLAAYLNNLFTEDNPKKDIPVAKYIAGDKDTEALAGDDLDKLIAEFNN